MSQSFRTAYLGIAAGLFGAGIAGCGSGSPMETYPDAVISPTDGGVDVVGPRLDAGGDALKPEPMSSQTNVRLISRAVRFLSSGPTCTSEAGSTADRWCAFVTPSTSSLDNEDLFVVNVTRAAAGTPIACGGVAPDPNCLRLTRGFFEEADLPAPHAALFQGDTLVFFDVFGTPFGWRPGMLNARVLTESSGGDVHDCFPARKGNAIACFRDLPTSTTSVTMTDVLVGRLDAPAEFPLIRVETVVSESVADAQVRRFQFGFATPNGDTVAWAARQTEDGPELLRARKVDDPASLRTVATDVSRWSASADGARWYWLKGFANVNGTTTGDLQTAAWDGSGATTMIAGVHDYAPSSSGPVAALTSTLELKSVKNPATAPTTVTDLDIGVRGLMAVGAEHVVYLKRFDSIFPLSDGYVRRIDGTQASPCTLTTTLDVLRYGLRFLPDSTGLLWARVTTLDVPIGDLPPIDATLTNLSTCSRTIIGSKIGDGDWDVANGAGLVFIDQSDNSDGSLRFRGLAGGTTLEPASLIHTRVDAFIPVFPPGAVLFTVNAASSKDGLYLNVARGGPSGVDGGTPANDAATTDTGPVVAGDAAAGADSGPSAGDGGTAGGG